MPNFSFLAQIAAGSTSSQMTGNGALALPGWESWSFQPLPALALLVAAGLYVNAYRRAQHRSGGLGAGHWIPYFAGILTIAVALMSPLDPIGESYLLSAHTLQHVLLQDVAPALLVLGLRAPLLPLGLPRRALAALAPGGSLGRPIAALTKPWLVLLLWAAATWIWAIPAVFDYSAGHALVHDMEHLSMLVAGTALWWLVIDPLPASRLRPNGQRLAILGISRLISAAVCLPLTWLPRAEYPRYAGTTHLYGLTALSDQSLGGAAMCFTEFTLFGIAFVAVFLSLLARSSARDALEARAAATA